MDADMRSASTLIPDHLLRFPNTDGSRVPLDVYRSQEIYDRDASPAQGNEQQSREFAPADAPTRAANGSSNLLARRSASSQPTIRPTTSFISAEITSLPPSTKLPGGRHSRSGRKSAALVRDQIPNALRNRLHSANSTRQVDGALSSPITGDSGKSIIGDNAGRAGHSVGIDYDVATQNVIGLCP